MTAPDLFPIFQRLKEVFLPYSNELILKYDKNDEFYLDTKFVMKNKKPMYFGSVKINKNYVSFHLMPVYVFPDLLINVSSNLKKRMQGKSCFNFSNINETLFIELAELTQSGYVRYEEAGYL